MGAHQRRVGGAASQIGGGRRLARQGRGRRQLFDWTRLGFDHYLRQKEWGSRDYLQKQLGVVAYMGESICDVAIAEDRNKSRSPGCEGLLPGGGQLREVVVADDDDDDDDDE